MMQKSIRKAIIPQAGLDIIFLLETKVKLKKIILIVDKVTLEYIIEKCVIS